MERLKIVLLLAAIIAAQDVPAQEQIDGPTNRISQPPSQPTFVVIGDVRNYNYFALPPAEKTTIREAVMNAGLLSESANVSVLRGTQDRSIWTQMISGADSGDTDEPVMNGDVLVVQAMQPVTEPVRKNAALRTESGVVVVALADDSIAVGDVLRHTGVSLSPNQLLKITCRFQGHRPVANADLADRVVHGDVITMSRSTRTIREGFGSMTPASSEWQLPVTEATTVTMMSDSSFPGNPPPDSAEQFLSNSLVRIPDTLSLPSAEPAEPIDHQPPITFSIDPKKSTLVQPVSQVGPTSSEFDVAPEPPVEIPILNDSPAEAASESMNGWNMLFIGVLLIAGTLILVGSLRADDENITAGFTLAEQCGAGAEQCGAGAEQGGAAVVSLRSLAGAISEKTEPSKPVLRQSVQQPQSPMLVEEFDKSEELAVATENSNEQPAPAAGEIVSETEWFGDEWRSRVSFSKSQIAGKQPSTRKEKTEPEDVHSSLVNIIVVDTLTKSGSIEGVLEGGPHSGHPTSPTEAPKPPSNGVGAVTTEQEAEPAFNASKGFSDLEDLLQNRLPIDLCKAVLPLRISLFGRPAGPRRLRVDAAHSKLAGPHVNISAEGRGTEAVMANAEGPTSESLSKEAVGGLDRALHFLQDRTDS